MSNNPFEQGRQAWEGPLNDMRKAFREGFGGRGRGRGHHDHGEHHDSTQHGAPGFPPEGLPGFPHRPGFGPGFGGPGFGGPGFGGGPGFQFGPGGFGPGGRGGRRGERRGGHGRGRARRGNVRNAVLILLNERPMHGYEIIKEIASRSGGWWRPSPGSVYPTLQLLADESLIVTEATDEGGKRLYTITDEGKAEAAKLDKTPPWEQAADEVDAGDVALREALMSLMDAARQVANVAGPELKTKATKLITDTRRELYLILADADPVGTDETDADTEPESDES